MTDNNENIDLNSDEFANTPKALRDWAERVKNENAVLREQVGKYQDTTLASVLTQAGFANPKRVTDAIRADKVDLSDTGKINEWIAQNGNDFARGAVQQQPAETPAPEQPAPDYSIQAQAQQQMQNLQNSGVPSGGRDPLAAAASEITDSMSKDEVLAILRRSGV